MVVGVWVVGVVVGVVDCVMVDWEGGVTMVDEGVVGGLGVMVFWFVFGLVVVVFGLVVVVGLEFVFWCFEVELGGEIVKFMSLGFCLDSCMIFFFMAICVCVHLCCLLFPSKFVVYTLLQCVHRNRS